MEKMRSKLVTDEQRKSFAHNLNDTLVECRFNNEKCTALDFEWSFERIYGNCYSFNVLAVIKRIKANEDHCELKLKIYTNFHYQLQYFYDRLGDF